MKTLKIGMVLLAVMLLAGSPVFARDGGEKDSSEQTLQLLMAENDSMMQMMHGMMDRFKEMTPESKGMQEMEAMMQEMAQMRMNHRMDLMVKENEQMMTLMQRVMGHLKEMESSEEGKQKMGMLMQQMDRMKTHHREMMER